MSQQSSFNELIEADLSKLMLQPGKVVTAKVVTISDDYVTVDAGLKSESDIPVAEFIVRIFALLAPYISPEPSNPLVPA